MELPMAPTSSCCLAPKKAWNTFSATRRRGALHLRRDFRRDKFRHILESTTKQLPCCPPTRTCAPRRNGRMPGDQRSGRHQYCRHRHRHHATWTPSPWSSSAARCQLRPSARFCFQECDTVGITRPCVKHNFLVRDVKDLAETMRRAFFIAPAPAVPAPCWSISRRTSPSRSASTRRKGEISMRSYAPVNKGHQGQIEEGRADAAARRASHDLHGRRRGPVRCRRGLAPPGGPDRRAVHQHPDGPGRDAGHRPPLPGHARHARHLRGEHGDAALRRAAGHQGALR